MKEIVSSLRLTKAALLHAMIAALFMTTALMAQDVMITETSKNLPEHGEIAVNQPKHFDEADVSRIEEELKNAIENGKNSRIRQLQNQLNDLVPETEELIPVADNSTVFDSSGAGETENDWALGAPVIMNGELNAEIAQYHRQLEMKMGEDGNIYVAVNRAPNGLIWKSKVDVYRSSNGGKTWISCGGFSSSTAYTYSIAMTIESRDNNVPDSTRINIFYSSSTNSSNTNAKLNFATFRRNGSAVYIAQIADPSSGYSIHSLSAVSDGAFWSGATYFGVIVCESDLTGTLANTKLRFVRTNNWGGSFASAYYLTNYPDYYPSAQFFNGSSDEVWIAVERRFSEENRQVRLIRTSWTVNAAYTTDFVTSGSQYRFEKPCLSIKQNNPCDTAVITCTRNNRPLYNYTPDGGATWVTNHSLSSSVSTDKLYTWCSSAPEGDHPFTFLYSTDDGQEISLRKGAAGALTMGIHYMVNDGTYSPDISPVCVTRQCPEGTLSAAAYAGNNGVNAYFNSEGHKFLSIKLAPQGLYNPLTNSLHANDQVSIVIKDNNAPFATVDSVTAVIDPVTMKTTSTYPSVSPVKLTELQTNNSYYIVVKHRNSIETWSASWVASNHDTITYDFTSASNKAFGNNLVQIDNSPVMYGIYSGDVNQDGTIDGSDLSLIDNDINIFATGYRSTDLNGDQFIDATDAAIADNNAYMFISVLKP